MKKTISIPACQVKDLGTIDYTKAWQLQKQAVQSICAGGQQYLFLCEHPLVLTLGRLAREDYILWPQSEIEKKGGKVIPIDRGGEVTLHASGQLVVYPIFDLSHFGKDLKLYLEKLEQVTIDLLRDFDIVASSLPGQRGVWVKERKIASIGIGVKKWISYHGLAVNVNTDLDLFSMIKPCGLEVRMTSIKDLKKETVDMARVKEKIISCFKSHFQLELI